MVTSAPRISAAGSPGSRRCSWDPTVAAATGTPSCAEANAPIGSGWPVSRIAAWVAADLHKPELSQFSAVDTDHHHGWAELLESVIVSFLGP
jgi:hypothetical protein